MWNSPHCAPVYGKIHATSTHPYRVAIKVTHKELVAKRMTKNKVIGGQHELVERSTTYYVHPEYKIPIDKTPDSAVAEGLAPRARVWQWNGEESLHLFWAIQRLSADELKKQISKDQIQRRFNVSLTDKQYNVVTVGNARGQSVSLTVSVSVPMITNETALDAGEDLYDVRSRQSHARTRNARTRRGRPMSPRYRSRQRPNTS